MLFMRRLGRCLPKSRLKVDACSIPVPLSVTSMHTNFPSRATSPGALGRATMVMLLPARIEDDVEKRQFELHSRVRPVLPSHGIDLGNQPVLPASLSPTLASRS